MSIATQLTSNGIKSILQSQKKQITDTSYIFQIIDMKKFDDKKSIKLRLVLSDGIATVTALVNSHAFEGVKNLDLRINSIVSVSGFKINQVKGKNVLIIESPFKLIDKYSQIGSPKAFEKLTDSEFNKNVDLTFKREKENIESNSFQESSQKAEEEKNSEKKEFKKQAQPVKRNQGFVEIMENEQVQTDYTPISALNTMNHDWKIKVRVTKKGQPRQWRNFKGEGELMNIELMDQFGDMIQGTFFNKLVEKFKDQVQENKVYVIEKGYIKPANSRYTSIKNDLCVTFSKDTIVTPVEDDNTIAADGFCYSTIDQASKLENGAILDIKGVVIHVQDMDEITMKNGTRKPIRRIIIADSSKAPGISIQVTFWGNIAYKANFDVGNIVACKDAKLGTYNSVSLNMSDEWEVKKIKDENTLSKWFETMKDKLKDIIPLSEQNKNIFKSQEAGMKSELIERIMARVQDDLEEEHAPTYVVDCYIVFIAKADNMVYMACPEDKKKVQNDPGREDWYCERWDKYYDEPVPTYMVNAKLTDGTGTIFASFYAEQGEQLFNGFSAKEFSNLQKYGTDQEVKDKIEDFLHRPIRVLLKARPDDFGREEGKIKWFGQKVLTYKYTAHNVNLIDKLKEYQEQARK